MTKANLWSCYFLGNAGLLLIYLLPQMVGIVSESMSLTPVQEGQFASSDLVGSAIASISSFFWIRKFNWKKVALIGLMLIMAGNSLSIFQDDFTSLLMIRFITGIGEGIAIALALVVLNDSEETERNFAMYLILTLVVGALSVELIPLLSKVSSVAVIFGLQILMALIAVPLVISFLPVNKIIEKGSGKLIGLSHKSSIGLAGILIMFIGYGGLWAFSERIGKDQGFSQDFIADALFISLVAAIIGLLIPIMVANKYGRMVPIIISAAGLIVFGIFISSQPSPVMFVAALIIGSFAINMILPYATGILAESDQTGKAMVMVMPMYSIGFALGPFALSIFYHYGGYSLVAVVTTLIFSIACTSFVYASFKKKSM
ncbi:MFS transporter [Lutimonas saemankumensis]|uniref:MFS transporter n=1 Tax=Lutimonas saemankumensis TaxID=483016 RepID=UPI001CD26E8A|nr:MFS transporter [Lutimonas saemankumensis]MCA0933651.1 MFS transporter [Lutimonas saemankumensis]